MLIAKRFCGPNDSANGGYACGMVAGLFDAEESVEVTLRAPPPLDRPLEVERVAEGVRVCADGLVVAEGRPAMVDVVVPSAPTFAEAERAARRYPWLEHGHPYPSCFVCGPARAQGDGLRIFPGLVEGRELAAAPFIPDPSLSDAQGLVRPEIMWSALDCPSWFGQLSVRGWDGGLVLLGKLTARVDSRPRIGERCITVGFPLGRDGRKVYAGSAIFREDGTLCALARATWIALNKPVVS